MAQYHFIRKDSELPRLRVELVCDGKYEFMKEAHLYGAIQNADVTFSMWDEHDVLKIADAPCNVILTDEDTCAERYIIEYAWKKRDTRKPGIYKGKFKIQFKDDLYQDGHTYEGGDLIMPIYEDLMIQIQP